MRLALIHTPAAGARAAAVRSTLRGMALAAPGPAAVVLLTREAPDDPGVESALRRARAARVPIVGLRLDAVAPAGGWLRAAGPIRWYDAFDGLTPDGLGELADALQHLAKPAPAAVVPFQAPEPRVRPAWQQTRSDRRRLRATPLTSHGGLSCVTASPDGRTVALGWKSGAVSIWNDVLGERLLTRHTAAVTALAVELGGRRLAAAGADGAFSAWDVVEKTPLVPWQPDGPRPPFCFTSAGDQLLSARGGRLEIWSLGPLARTLEDTPAPDFTEFTRISVDCLDQAVFLGGHRAATPHEAAGPGYGLFNLNSREWSPFHVEGSLLQVSPLPRSELSEEEIFFGLHTNPFVAVTYGGAAGRIEMFDRAHFTPVITYDDGALPLSVHGWRGRWLAFAHDARHGRQRLRIRVLRKGRTVEATLDMPGVPKHVSVYEDRLQVVVGDGEKLGICVTGVPFAPV